MRLSPRIAALAAALLLPACTAVPPPAAMVAALPAVVEAPVEQRAPVTILVSIDGFRPDYLDQGVTPVLSRLRTDGASGPMHPSFPSKTYPNHWTLVTGLRPDRHGIVANKMEDPARPGETFTMATDDPAWWSAADPIWVDAERAGIRTATMFWPGANVAIGGHREKPSDWETFGGARPSDWAEFNQSITGEQRVNGVLDWLRRPAAIRPRFVTLYFDTVDHEGHNHGPRGAETLAAVAEVDRRIGQLVDGLAEMDQPANLVIVSDHGMAEKDASRVIDLSTMLNKDDYHAVDSGVNLMLAPAPGKKAKVERVLLGHHPHFDCWRKGEMPARFHYGTNPRVPPIFCLPQVGWVIYTSAPTKTVTGGDHGYDNMAPDMTALFIASGPAFRPATLPAFDNVDVYPLLRDLLGLPPKPGVDGDDRVFSPAMTR